MKKKLAVILAMLMLVCSLALPVAAEGGGDPDPDAGISPLAEEFEVAYRYHNGKYQYRIWSRTYGRWVTDWTDC